jgi:hypothetical protein
MDVTDILHSKRSPSLTTSEQAPFPTASEYASNGAAQHLNAAHVQDLTRCHAEVDALETLVEVRIRAYHHDRSRAQCSYCLTHGQFSITRDDTSPVFDLRT